MSSDITKCEGYDCPLKETCYRYTVTPNEFRQSYFMTNPYNKQNLTCEFYYGRQEIKTKGKIRKEED